jgi:DNA-directed RNA polymerase specialized sigma24 family protein
VWRDVGLDPHSPSWDDRVEIVMQNGYILGTPSSETSPTDQGAGASAKFSGGCGDIEGVGPISTDAELLRRSVAEPALFAGLYERHGTFVWRYVVRRVGVDAADDLVAEVFERAFRARERYRGMSGSGLPWLLGVASNVIADHRRAERRRLAALERLARSAPELIEHEAAGLAPGARARAPGPSRPSTGTLLLVVWGELSYEEAANALDVPVGTVASRIACARRRLAGGLGRAATPRSSDRYLRGEANA